MIIDGMTRIKFIHIFNNFFVNNNEKIIMTSIQMSIKVKQIEKNHKNLEILNTIKSLFNFIQ